MNEIRMYVEHLFEGRMLTAENIELKEEIYGNLVARYEDYVAGGMDPAEALEKTKASMSSIDDVIEGVDDVRETARADNGDAAKADTAETTVLPNAAVAKDSSPAQPGTVGETVAMPVAGAPLPPAGFEGEVDEDVASVSSSANAAASKGKRTRNIIIAAAAGFALFVVVGVGLIYALRIDRVEDRADSAATEVQNSGQSTTNGGTASGQQSGQANGQSNSGQGNGASARNKEVVVDADGTVWVDGELGDDIAVAVANAQPGDISLYAETDPSDAANVESLIRLLPMSEWATDIDVTLGVDVLGFAYREVPDGYDGDSIDLALSYNTMALFCSMPLLNEVCVTVTEADDPMDEDYYVFTRDNAQSRFGVMLSADMMNEAGWHQLKEDNLYNRKFAENMVDAAEREWL
ncbi:permease prefix domain 1-containing protein [Collinsella tanakaei]|uniref:permease prefix domain 1-containing protein n=1 Tax=Collinsella tanakaei TaxID=626935 RepID=UPI002943B8E0|nr:permease prefix domain 1-containing protein [Collinsella tanakaei]